jgi:hypothetical protein
MTSYKFNLNPKEPRDEQIMRHKDFGKVMQNYQRMTHPLYRTPLYRYRKIFLIVLIVLIVAWLIAEFGDVEKEHGPQRQDTIRESEK